MTSTSSQSDPEEKTTTPATSVGLIKHRSELIDWGNGGLQVYRDNLLVWISTLDKGKVVATKLLGEYATVAEASIAEHLARAAVIAVTAGCSRRVLLDTHEKIECDLDALGVLMDRPDDVFPYSFVEEDRGRYQYAVVDRTTNIMVVGEYGSYAEAQEIPEDATAHRPG